VTFYQATHSILQTVSHLFSWNLNPEIAACDHDPIGRFENFVKAFHALVVLDLCDDLDVLSLLAENLADSVHSLSAAYKRCKHDVDAHVDAELKVLAITVRHDWQVDGRSRQVYTLLRTQNTSNVYNTLTTNTPLVKKLAGKERQF